MQQMSNEPVLRGGSMNKKYMPPKGFQERLYRSFIESGVKLTDLSRDTGISRSSIYCYFYNGATPNTVTLARIARSLNVSLDWLVFGYGPMELGKRGWPC